MKQSTPRIIAIGTELTCKCCDVEFKAWAGYSDTDLGSDKGTCITCAEETETLTEDSLTKLIKLVRKTFDVEYLAIFDAAPRASQASVAMTEWANGRVDFRVAR